MANHAAILAKPGDDRWYADTSLSEIGQLAFHLECSACDWRLSSYTIIEAKAHAEFHYTENPEHQKESISVVGRLEFEVLKI